jgi:hypothetical protein
MELNQFLAANKDNPAIGKYIAILGQARDKLAAITAQLPKLSKSDPYYPVLFATPFLELFAEIVCSYLLLEHAKVASEKLNAIYAGRGADDDAKKKALLGDSVEAAFYHNKIQTAAFYVTNILPGVFAKEYSFGTGDRSPLDFVF